MWGVDPPTQSLWGVDPPPSRCVVIVPTAPSRPEVGQTGGSAPVKCGRQKEQVLTKDSHEG